MGRIAYTLKVKAHGRFINAFISTTRSRKVVEASSRERILKDNRGKGGSLDSAMLVGAALAQRMKHRFIFRARFDLRNELLTQDPKMHECIKTVAEAVIDNGIELF